MKKVTVIGGGTGGYVVLSSLKEYSLDLNAIVTMMDSGGSTGRLRDQLGVLPPGDLRQCLVALSEAPLLWRKLFLYRFEKGDLDGHNFGNIFLSALEKVSSDYDEVMKTAHYVLKTKGEVIPVTFENTHICVQYASGSIVKGEGNIDKNYNEKTHVVKAFLEPEVAANPKAIERIKKSDFIIIGPGDMYASIIPILLIKGIKQALKKTKAKFIYNMNLMTKSGQTTNYKASNHIRDIEHFTGRSPDIVIINNGNVPPDILNWYTSHSEKVVENDLKQVGLRSKIIERDLVDRNNYMKQSADKFVNPLVRSVLRHDSHTLAKVIYNTII